MASIARLVVSLGANVSSFETDMKRAASLSKRELAKMERQAEQLNKKWNTQFKYAGAAVVAGLGIAIKKAAEFEKAMAEVSTLLDDTSAIDRTSNAVKDLSVQFGQAPVTQAKALYQIISAGATDSATQIEQLTASNRLAVGGMTDVATAADGLTTVLNAYAGQGVDSERVTDALFTTMRLGKTTIGELSTSIGTVATVAAQTGVSIEEVGAAVGTLTKAGIATGESMSALRGVLAAVLKQSDQSVKMAKELGVEFDVAALKTKGLAKFLEDIANSGATETQLAKLFGRVEGLSAVMAIGANNAAEFTAQLEAQADKAGATGDAVSKVMETTAFRADQARAALETLSIEIGERFLSVISKASIQFVKYIDEIQVAVESLAAVVITRVGVGMAAAFLKAAQAGRSLATVMAFVGGPVGLLATGVALLVVNWDNLIQRKDGVGEFARQLHRGFTVLWGVVKAVGAELLNLAQIAVNITQVVGAPITAMVRQFTLAQEAIRSGDLSGAVAAITSVGAEASREASAALANLKRNLTEVGDSSQYMRDAWVEAGRAFLEPNKNLQALEEAAQNFLRVAAEGRAAAVRFAASMGTTGKSAATGAKGIDKISDAAKQARVRLLLLSEVWSDAYEVLDEVIGIQKEYEETLKNIEDRIYPVNRLVREFEKEQAALNRALKEGRITAEEYQRSINFLTDSLGKAAAQTIETKKETDIWTESMLEGVRILERSFTSAWESIIDGSKGAFKGILDGFKTLLANMLHQLTTAPLLKELEKLLKGEIGVGGLDFGKLGQALAGIGGVGIGSILGGGGTGASIGAALGTAAGSVIGGAVAGPIGSAIGKVLGGVIGGFAGGLFDDKPDFELQLVGAGLIGDPQLQGRNGPFTNTALGGFFTTNTGDLDPSDVAKFEQALVDFDNAFAGFLNENQLQDVTKLLERFGIELDGDALTIEGFISERLRVIQYALDGTVLGFVKAAKNLEDEANRTGVAFLTGTLFSQQPELFSGRTQTEFLAVVEAFQDGTETIIDAFNEVIALLDTVVAVTDSLAAFSSSNLLNDFNALLALQNETPLQTLTRLSSALSDAIFSFSGGTDDLVEIGNLTQQVRQGEIQLLTQIDQIQKGINKSLERLKQDVQGIIEGPKTADEILSEAEALIQAVAQASTVEDIADLSAQFESLIRTLSEGDIASMGDAVLSLIEAFQAAANTALEAAKASAIESAESIRELVGTFLDEVGDPLSIIAASNERAAKALENLAGGTIQAEGFMDNPNWPYEQAEIISLDINETLNEGLEEQNRVLEDGAVLMSKTMGASMIKLERALETAISQGFNGVNINVNVTVDQSDLTNE